MASEVIQMIQVMDGEQTMSYHAGNDWNLLLQSSSHLYLPFSYQGTTYIYISTCQGISYQGTHRLSIEELYNSITNMFDNASKENAQKRHTTQHNIDRQQLNIKS